MNKQVKNDITHYKNNKGKDLFNNLSIKNEKFRIYMGIWHKIMGKRGVYRMCSVTDLFSIYKLNQRR